MPNTEIFTRSNRSASNAQRRLLTNVGVVLTLVASCLASVAQWGCWAQENTSRTAWKTGIDLEQQLDLSASVRWGNAAALRPTITSFAQIQGVAVFLDRRVDPEKNIDFSVSQSEMLSLWSLLQQFAAYLQQGISRIGPTIYIGPTSCTRVLATVAAIRSEETALLPAESQRRLQRATPLSWPELATPRQLIQQVGQSYGVQVEGIEQIPHDLWPAVDLPRLTFAEQMTLLLAGFDLTFAFQDNGNRIQLVPLPDRVVVQRDYALRSSASRTVDEIGHQLPDVRTTIRSGRLLAEGTVEEHDLIRQLLSGRPATKPANKPPVGSETRYTTTFKNEPVGGVATVLAKNLGREIRFDPRVTDRLHDLVSLDVQDATLDELLRAVLDPVGLSYELDDQTLSILPRLPE